MNRPFPSITACGDIQRWQLRPKPVAGQQEGILSIVVLCFDAGFQHADWCFSPQLLLVVLLTCGTCLGGGPTEDLHPCIPAGYVKLGEVLRWVVQFTKARMGGLGVWVCGGGGGGGGGHDTWMG